MTILEEMKEQAPGMLGGALQMAFGNDGAALAAEAAAAGSVEAIDDTLSERDRRMLAIGTLAGVARTMARVTFPFDEARRVVAKDREGNPLFDEVLA